MGHAVEGSYTMSQPQRIHVTVSVDDAHAGKLDEVAARLRSAGLEVERSLASIGTITGRVEHSRLGDLSKVQGVAAVEPERSFQLPPPGSKIQ